MIGLILKAKMADVWITWCKRTQNCRYCEQPILPGTPMVKVRFRTRIQHWAIHRKFHPNCWLEQGIKALPDYGYGKLTNEQRAERKNSSREVGPLKQGYVKPLKQISSQPLPASIYCLSPLKPNSVGLEVYLRNG